MRAIGADEAWQCTGSRASWRPGASASPPTTVSGSITPSLSKLALANGRGLDLPTTADSDRANLVLGGPRAGPATLPLTGPAPVVVSRPAIWMAGHVRRCEGSRTMKQRCSGRAFRLLIVLVGLAALLPTPARADGAWAAVGPSAAIGALASDPSGQTLYAGGAGGVWASTDGGVTWPQVSAVAMQQLAVDPFTAGMLYASEAAPGAPRIGVVSRDGAAHWQQLALPGVSGQAGSGVDVVVPDPNRQGVLFAGGTDQEGAAAVWRSTDGGATWAVISGPSTPSDFVMDTIDRLALLPGAPGVLYAGGATYHGSILMATTDALAAAPVWHDIGPLAPFMDLGPLVAAGDAADHALSAALDQYEAAPGPGGTAQTNVVVSKDDGALTGIDGGLQAATGGSDDVTALAVEPAQPAWLYAAVIAGSPAPSANAAGQLSRVFASSDFGQTWQAVDTPGTALPAPATALLLQPGAHALLAATAQGVYRRPISWPPSARFASYYQTRDGLRLLGAALSLETVVSGYPAQYFEKGRLEDHAADGMPADWRFMDGLLVDELQQAAVPLPIGGDRSAMTYADLHRLADPAHRLPPPAGYPGSGVLALADGTTFVPFTSDLAGAPGHVVPAVFWAYLNRADLFPGGWLHDVGLPISEAATVQVTKNVPSGPVQHTILIQAFQRTILTDDPQNPAGWQVERANVGTDYRKAFPARVGP